MKDIYYSVKKMLELTVLLYLINIIMSFKKMLLTFINFLLKYRFFFLEYRGLNLKCSPFIYRLLIKVREYPTRSNWMCYN